jgi:membrane dipeptidase
VLAESRQPVIFSHTRPYALRQIARHLEDKDMMAIAKKGGVIGIWPLLRRRETIETLFKGVEHVKKLVGVDHIGIGTDLFGLGDTTSVPTHKAFALIPAGLLNRGYSESDVVKVGGGNFMRVFAEISAHGGS